MSGWIGLVVVLVAVGWGCWRLERMVRQGPVQIVHPVPVAKPALQGVPSVLIRLIGEAGQSLGVTSLPVRDRRVNMHAWTSEGKLEQFMASHQEGAEWVYRRVGPHISASSRQH